jgi:hypothetical protein
MIPSFTDENCKTAKHSMTPHVAKLKDLVVNSSR